VAASRPAKSPHKCSSARALFGQMLAWKIICCGAQKFIEMTQLFAIGGVGGV